MGWHVLRWLKQQVVQDVPDELALCEFDCRKEQCTHHEWATCERRINRAAEGLFPSHSVIFDARAINAAALNGGRLRPPATPHWSDG